MKPQPLTIEEVKHLLEENGYIKRCLMDDGREVYSIRYPKGENWEDRGIGAFTWSQLQAEGFIELEEETHMRGGRVQRWVYFEEMIEK